MSKEIYYEGAYDLSEEDKKYEINTIDSYWTQIRYAIEELYFGRVIPKDIYLKIEDLNKDLCPHIGHIWMMDQCNHLEHAVCARCRTTAKTIEHVKEMRVQFPMGKIGQIKGDYPVFKEFERLNT